MQQCYVEEKIISQPKEEMANFICAIYEDYNLETSQKAQRTVPSIESQDTVR